MEEKEKAPVRTVGVMMVITLLGKALGLVRDRLLTVHYGSGMAANAFLTASRIPRVFFDTVFASAISASFIPVFSELLRKRGKEEAMGFASQFLTVMGLLCALLSGLGMLAPEALSTLFADGYDPATAALCAELTRIMMPTILFTGVAFSFVGVLQSMEEFNIPAAISLVSNAAVILYFLFFNERFGIYGLAAAYLIAWGLQAVVQIPALRKKGFRYRFAFSLRSEGMKKVFRLMVPVMVSAWVLPLNQTVNSRFASHLFHGSGVSAVELAYNLFSVIAGVFVLSVTNYIFPRLSREHADGDRDALRLTVRETMHTVLFVVLPMTAGLAVMAEPLVRFIYGGGAFDDFSIAITARALGVMSLGMVGFAGQAVLSRVFFAEQNGRAPLLAGGASILINILLCQLLSGPLDVAGIAAASAVSFAVNALALALALRLRGDGFADRAFLRDMGKILLASLLMAGAAWAASSLLKGHVGKLLGLALPVGVGVVVYAGLAFALKLPETQLVTSFLRKR